MSALARYREVAEQPPIQRIINVDWRLRPPAVKRYPPAGRVPGPDWLMTALDAAYGFSRLDWDLTPAGSAPSWTPSEAATRTVHSGRAAGDLRRPVPCGGGMGSAEVYLLGPAVAGRAPVVTHLDPAAGALDLLGECTDQLTWGRAVGAALPAVFGAAGATGDRAGTAFAVVVTSLYARLAFKYGDFAYRLQCLDSGAVTEALVLALGAAECRVQVLADVDDDALADLLGLDLDSEVPMTMLAVLPPATRSARPADVRVPPPPRPVRPTVATTPRAELPGLPEIRALRAAPREAGPDAPASSVSAGRGVESDWTTASSTHAVSLPGVGSDLAGASSRRRSADGRLCGSLALAALAALLTGALRTVTESDPGEPRELDLYVLAFNVAGLAPGAYRYLAEPDRLVGPRSPDPAGPVRARPGETGGAAAHVYLVGDLPAAAPARCYQLLNLAAGRAAHRVGVAAAAVGVGARIQCSYRTEDVVETLGLLGDRRPLCQIVTGPADTVLSYSQPIVS